MTEPQPKVTLKNVTMGAAWVDGLEACEEGKLATANPWPVKTEGHAAWLSGFAEGKPPASGVSIWEQRK